MNKLRYNNKRKIIIVSFLILAIYANFAIFSHLLYQYNSSNKVQEKTFEFYNLKFSGQEINITTPENKTYTAPMSGYYPASYGFENDVLNGFPSGWTTFEGGGCTVNVISEVGGHKNVVELYDNGIGTTNRAEINNTFADQTTGIIEFWYRRIDPTEYVFWRLCEDNTIASTMGSEGGTFQRNFQNGSWQSLAPCNSDQWYHIRIDFDTNADLLNLTIDGTQVLTNGDFMNDTTSINKLVFFTRGWGVANYRGYYDAVGYSWDPNYNIGDNLDEGLLLSFDTNLNLNWIGYSLDNQANITILGNTTIPFQSEGVHRIQMFGNDTFGRIFQSDIRYFTTLYYPVIIINSPYPNEFFGIGAPNFDISIIESNLQSRWYSLNGGVNITFGGFTGTINQTEWDKLINGSITIRFYANDSWGLEGYTEVTIQKDLFAPNSSISFILHSGIDVVNESTEFSLTADDGLGSGISLIRYKVNDSSWITYSTPFTLANYPYGDILISYQAVDQVDNYETIQTLVVHRTDTIAPTSSISFTPYTDPDIVIRSTIFTITSDDGLGSGISLIRYKIDDSIWFDYLGPFDLSNYQDGDHNITYQAIDVVGNIEIEHAIVVELIQEPSQPGIPGFHLFIMLLSIIGIISTIIFKKKLKFEF